MSRSIKKHPSYTQWRGRNFYKRAHKKAERRAVKVAISKERWEHIPHRKEVGSYFGYKNSFISDSYCADSAIRVSEYVAEADQSQTYLLCKRPNVPFDCVREWRISWSKRYIKYESSINKYIVDDLIDNTIQLPYYEVIAYIRGWLPIGENQSPIDLRMLDSKFVKKSLMRK